MNSEKKFKYATPEKPSSPRLVSRNSSAYFHGVSVGMAGGDFFKNPFEFGRDSHFEWNLGYSDGLTQYYNHAIYKRNRPDRRCTSCHFACDCRESRVSELLKSMMRQHSDPMSPGYNGCDENLCGWCVEAKLLVSCELSNDNI